MGNWKKCAKIPRSNRKPEKPEKSQGQIFQECQGQIPKVKWENKNGKPEKPVLTGKNGKIKMGNRF